MECGDKIVEYIPGTYMVSECKVINLNKVMDKDRFDLKINNNATSKIQCSLLTMFHTYQIRLICHHH